MSLLLLSLLACGPEATPPASLAAVSEEIQFTSVDRLGPHHFVGSIQRGSRNEAGRTTTTEEAVEITWQDWGTFSYRRVVNGRPVLAVVTLEGQSWVERPDGRWQARGDAEPYRQELRAGWNLWEQALSEYDGRLLLEGASVDVVEGRPARRYTVALRPLPETADPAELDRRRRQATQQGEPTAASGTVALDESTAVRLTADVRAERRVGQTTHTVAITLRRSAIGEPQNISKPEEVAAPVDPLAAAEAPPPRADRPDKPPPSSRKGGGRKPKSKEAREP